MTIIAVCGMQSEVSAIGAHEGVVIVQGQDNDAALPSQIEDVIAAGSVQGVISLGVSGALAPSLKAGDIVVATAATDGATKIRAHNDWRINIFAALSDVGFTHPFSQGVIGYSSGIVATAADKAALMGTQNADVVDMETFVAAKVADAYGLPFAAVRIMSDGPDESLPAAALVAMTSGGAINYRAVLQAVLANPMQDPALATLASNGMMALDRLAAAVMQLGVRLEFPG